MRPRSHSLTTTYLSALINQILKTHEDLFKGPSLSQPPPDEILWFFEGHSKPP